jgi:hypothetical protein
MQIRKRVIATSTWFFLSTQNMIFRGKKKKKKNHAFYKVTTYTYPKAQI